MGTCENCGAVNVQVIGPIGLATCIPCRRAYAQRLDRIVPPINKVIGHYQDGLITPDDLITALIQIGAE